MFFFALLASVADPDPVYTLYSTVYIHTGLVLTDLNGNRVLTTDENFPQKSVRIRSGPKKVRIGRFGCCVEKPNGLISVDI